MTSDDKQLKLKKSVAGIQCKPSSAVSLVARKLINVCVYHVYNELKTGDWHKIHIDTLHTYFGYTGNNWKLLSTAFEDLQKIIFTWNAFGDVPKVDESKSYQRSVLISSLKWNAETREFCWKFGDGIPDLFHYPQQYASLTLDMQSKFASVYSLVLYEQCLRYVTSPGGTRWFSVQDLRDIFGVEGRYESYKDFNKWVLKPAITEINTVSDIKVDPEFQKKGTSVTHVKFNVEYKRQLPLSETINDERALRAEEILVNEFSVEKRMVEHLLLTVPLEKIFSGIDYVRNTSAYKDKRGNIAGYVVKAIKEGFSKEVAAAFDVKVEKPTSKRKKEENDTNIRRTLDDLKEKYQKYINLEVSKFLENLDESTLAKFTADFLSEKQEIIEQATAVDKLAKKKRDPMESPLVKRAFNSYLISKSNLSESIKSIETFEASLKETITVG